MTNEEAGIRPDFVGSHDVDIVTAEVTRIFHVQGKEPNAVDLAYWVRQRVVPSSNGWDAYWVSRMLPAGWPLPLPMEVLPPATPPPAPLQLQLQLDRMDAKLDLLVNGLRKYF